MQTNNNQYRIRVNNYIKVPQVRVILEDGTSAGVMSTRDAIKMALDQGLDLVEINPKSIPPVCKIIDYGKFKYDEKKKQNEAKKNQKVQELKEITFRPNTDENDLNHKLESAKSFLEEGHKVKFTIRFRGREIVHPEVGGDKINWILEQLKELIIAPPPISLEGKFMSIIVSPTKKVN
jgi:translation initiation factor IF-3